MKPSQIFNAFLTVLLATALLVAGFWVNRWLTESRILRQVIERLSADTRIAEVLVTKSELDETTKKIHTTVKFLEYSAEGGSASGGDTKEKSLPAKYFTFEGNIIQFQSLVIRFEDALVRSGDHVKGKSVYLFMKAFVLDEKGAQVFNISPAHSIPAGYKIPGETSAFEAGLWEEFWDYALDPNARHRAGIKNAQIEAPGSMFLPGMIYTVRIEHDGGLRIDAEPVPEILKGEKI